MEKIKSCIAGCQHFTGGEVYHHKDCPHYPESFSKMYDKLFDKLRTLLDSLPNNDVIELKGTQSTIDYFGHRDKDTERGFENGAKWVVDNIRKILKSL